MSCPHAAKAAESEAPKKCPFAAGAAPAAEGAPAGKCPFAAKAQQQDPTEGGEVKQYFRDTYNGVASTAAKRGNVAKARVLLGRMGYTAAQIELIGDDAANMQGTGCPHVAAGIKPGDTVLDLGSGLGIDAFVASAAVGPEGKVIGVDIAEGEVRHATERRDKRGITNVEFRHGDMEALELPDNSVDVVISNGGFCLAPNKPQGFREIFRVLKPGGRMAVCCSTLRGALPEGIDWPICMKQFMRLDHAEEIIGAAGFEGIVIDTSDSKMSYGDDVDIPSPNPDEPAPLCKYAKAAQEKRAKEEAAEAGEQAPAASGSGRIGVHMGDLRFQHLKDWNMDNLCARILAHATKPTA